MEQFSLNQMVGDYRITAFLGAGGMGEVYQGVHVKLGRCAAIKVLSRVAPNPSLTTRFFNEARVQSSIQHPNIAALYDFQEIGGRLFIFMEFVDGESLEDLIKRRAFTVEDALKTFQSICEAVAFIHERGIIHRDIKSPNIKLTSGGTVKLLDFGIAKDAASENLTKVGGIIGTPRYLAPEQLLGEPANCQTDIWALGILLYEMLTGVEPFDSDSILTLYRQIKDARFEKPERLNSAVTKKASEIVSRCLTVNTAERYQTADELARDVRNALGGEKLSSSGGRQSRFLRKNVASAGGKTGDAEFGDADSNRMSSDYSTPQPRKSPFAAVAANSILGVLLLFALVAVGIWAMNGSGGESPKNNKANVVLPDKFFGNQNAKIAAAPPQSPTFTTRINVFEGGAQVFRDGAQIGRTPFDLEAAEGEKVELTLKLDGFQDKTVQINVSVRKKVYTYSLTPKE